MADVLIDKFRVKVVRQGTTPANPGNVTTDPLPPVNPPGSNGNSGPTGIGILLNNLVIGGVKRLIESNERLTIPQYWEYDITGLFLTVDGVIDCDGEIYVNGMNYGTT